MGAELPPPPFFDVMQSAQQLAVAPWEIVAYAINGAFRILLATPEIKTSPDRFLNGLVEIDPAACFRLFKRDDVKSVQVRRVREVNGQHWELISEPHEGIEITTSDPLILAVELEAFINGNAGVSPERPAAPASQRPVRGQSIARHDWEGFSAALTKEIHDNGVPATMQALATRMETWFVENGDPTKVPDISTIRKKILPVWNALRAA